MRKQSKSKSVSDDNQKINEKKWTKPLMNAGWTVVPSIFIEKQEAIGLNPIDMNIIFHLVHYWWKADQLPYPSVGTIAKALGLSKRTIQKHLKGLEEDRLIKRIERRSPGKGSDTNLYSFDGLIETLKPYAEEKIREKEENIKRKNDRLARKKPKLVVDNDQSEQ